MKKKIVLIGMMGSGKTTVGRILSKRLKINFIDTDVLIEKKCGIKIKKIFDKYGEEYFRHKEEKIILDILLNNKKPGIIALGGGAFLNKKLQKIILKETISIWLNVSIDLIHKRCKKTKFLFKIVFLVPPPFSALGKGKKIVLDTPCSAGARSTSSIRGHPISEIPIWRSPYATQEFDVLPPFSRRVRPNMSMAHFC